MQSSAFEYEQLLKREQQGADWLRASTLQRNVLYLMLQHLPTITPDSFRTVLFEIA